MGRVERNRDIWKFKIPLKIKIFMWYLHKVVVLIKDNLAKKNWSERKYCSFCLTDETIPHLFLVY
jgi:hypothetical protein